MLYKILIASILVCTGVVCDAQSNNDNCYKQWYQLFAERGAKPVPDGENEIILSIIKADVSNCYVGKLLVKGGKIVLGSLQIQTEDGSFEKFKRQLKKNVYYTPEQMTTTENGMSHSFLTSEDEIVRAFFYKSLNPPAKSLKKAPSPSEMGLK